MQKLCKNRHLHTLAQLCRAISSQLRHVSAIGKKPVKQQYFLHMSSRYGKLRRLRPNRSVGEFEAPQQISTGFMSWLRYCTDVAQRRSTKLCIMFGHLLSWYTMYTFWGGCCPLTELCQLQTSLCMQVLHSPILAGLLHGTRAVCVSQTLQCSTRNGITEISHTPLIFGRAAITLGIGPHNSSLSSLAMFHCHVKMM